MTMKNQCQRSFNNHKYVSIFFLYWASFHFSNGRNYYEQCWMLQVRVNMMSDFVYLSMINLFHAGDAMTRDKSRNELNDEFWTVFDSSIGSFEIYCILIYVLLVSYWLLCLFVVAVPPQTKQRDDSKHWTYMEWKIESESERARERKSKGVL